ncbi:MAG TPA: hypothetical protein VK553_07255 [Candidatus Nitrosopolaris rasttigaisensis]|jgi:hypothetical protein|nr:hypothetical protein [Candidatus Nitrosopolaris rasttigaisensis]
MRGQTDTVTKFRFAGKVSKMGETKKTGHPNLVIWIPHELHDDPQFKKIKAKRLIIQLDDEI